LKEIGNMQVLCRRSKLHQIIKRFGSTRRKKAHDDALMLVSVFFTADSCLVLVWDSWNVRIMYYHNSPLLSVRLGLNDSPFSVRERR